MSGSVTLLSAILAGLCALGAVYAPQRREMPTAGPPNIFELAAFLPDTQRRTVMKQCSRWSPQPGEAGWTPDGRTILNIERKLPDYLRKSPRETIPDPDAILPGSGRQYVGFVRAGHRFVYGNFFPARLIHENPKWRTQAIIVCDGGRAFFGLEFDPESGRITRVDFNGPY